MAAERDYVVDLNKNYIDGLWSDSQRRAMAAMADAIIGALTKEEKDAFYRTLPADMSPAQRKRIDEYAEMNFSEDPRRMNILAMYVTITVPEGMRMRTNLLLSTLGSAAGCLLLFGRLGPVWEIDRSLRTEALKSWSTSRLLMLRQGGNGIRGLTLIAFYRSCANAIEAIGYPIGDPTDWKHPPKGEEQVAAEHYPFKFLNESLPSPPTKTPVEIEADVVIVGSGCGGGVVADYLSRCGLKVVVVDKGIYVDPKHMNGDEEYGLMQMYDKLGLAPSKDGSIFILSGSGFGGGSRINWSASLKPLYFVRDSWEKKHGVPYFNSHAFAEDLDACLTRMGAGTDATQHNMSNSLLVLGAMRGGQPVNPVPQNTGGLPHYCGKCLYGCPSGHKMDGTRTFLQDAAQHGTQFLTKCHVQRILIKDGVATGVVGSVNGQPVRLNARRAVVTSCGSIQTPALLLRTPQLKSNTQIGKHLHLHPVAFVTGYYDYPIDPWEGGILTTVSNAAELVDKEGWGAKIEVGASTPSLYSAMIPFEGVLHHKARTVRFRYSFALIVIVRDKYGGSITIGNDGEPEINYSISEFDQRSMIEGVLRATEIHMNAGVSEIVTSQPGMRPFVNTTNVAVPNVKTSNTIPNMYNFQELPKQGDCTHPTFRKWQEEVRKGGAQPTKIMMGSAHQMSSCRIGADPKYSAADPIGRIRGAKNLWVADGSALPEATGVNPMLSILGTSRGIARNMARALGVETSTPAPHL